MRPALLALTLALPLAFAQQKPAPAQQQPAAPPPPHADVGNGHIAWFDITTTDLAKSRDFYGKLFDWKFTSLPGYEQLAVEIVAGDESIGTLRRAEGPISGYDGVVYVQVADIQASCAKAKELGATVIPGFPFNLTNRTGAIGLFLDPAGHPMGMYSRTPMAEAKTPAK
jgi:predicted enzyme related to lactoylglutathione lyase